MNTVATPPAAGLVRRLMACLYDTLLLLALWMSATLLWLPLTGGEAIAGPLYPLYKASLLLIALAFFCGFWCRAGQTLGMRAWHLRVEQPNGRRISLRQALIRCAVAPLSWAVAGLGFIWVLVDREGRSWHDIASGTRVVVAPATR